MYYSEKMIGNELHYKNLRNGPWIKFTHKMLNERIINNGDSNNG